MAKIAINGFGRIGKQFFLAALEKKEPWDFVINDIAELDSIVYSLKYDSVHPSLSDVSHDGKNLIMGKGLLSKKKIKFFSETEPAKLPWKQEKVDLVVECTGFFTDRKDAEKHITSGAKKVLVSAPAKNHDCTIVHGVNNEMLDKKHIIVSAGSCTTNCISVLVKVLHDAFKVKSAYFVTVHAYTATQKLIDAYDKKDFARGRAASQNIIPTTSGASQSVVESIPELKGRLDGYALRVPVIDGSIASVFAKIENPATKEKINAVFKERAQRDMKEILAYNEDKIVSSDIIHNPASCVFDANFTSVLDDTVSIAGWYDNEWGYSNRLVDVALSMLKK